MHEAVISFEGRPDHNPDQSSKLSLQSNLQFDTCIFSGKPHLELRMIMDGYFQPFSPGIAPRAKLMADLESR